MVPLVSQGPDWPQTPQQRTEWVLHSSPQSEFTLLGLLADATVQQQVFDGCTAINSIHHVTLVLWVPAGHVILELLAILCISVSADPPQLVLFQSSVPWVYQHRFTLFCRQSRAHCAHGLLCSHPDTSLFRPACGSSLAVLAQPREVLRDGGANGDCSVKSKRSTLDCRLSGLCFPRGTAKN